MPGLRHQSDAVLVQQRVGLHLSSSISIGCDPNESQSAAGRGAWGVVPPNSPLFSTRFGHTHFHKQTNIKRRAKDNFCPPFVFSLAKRSANLGLPARKKECRPWFASRASSALHFHSRCRPARSYRSTPKLSVSHRRCDQRPRGSTSAGLGPAPPGTRRGARPGWCRYTHRLLAAGNRQRGRPFRHVGRCG